MALIETNGIQIAFETSGPEDGQPLLLIYGVGAQLVRWPPELVDGLVAAGFRVIRFDNRDVGLSTHLNEAGRPDFAALGEARARGEKPALPYAVSDMAKDASGLLDALGIRDAHIVGVSLGGMVAQALAIARPDLVRTMTLVMTQSGNPALPPSDPDALAALAAPAPDPATDREGYLKHAVALNRVIGSPGYPASEASLRHFGELALARAFDPAGAARQLAASRYSPDRSADLAGLSVPTLVIHGADDALIPPACGEDLAHLLKLSWYFRVSGMGHDLPAELCPVFAKLIAANAARVFERPAAPQKR